MQKREKNLYIFIENNHTLKSVYISIFAIDTDMTFLIEYTKLFTI